MAEEEKLKQIEERKKKWKEETLVPSLKRFGVTESPNEFYSPLDVKDFDFLKDVGQDSTR